MSVTAPPRPARSREQIDPIDRDELEGLIEALIEEARRRARRRRRRYGACIMLVALASGGVYFGFDHAGGGAVGSRSAQTGSTGGAPSAPPVAGGRWEASHGPYGGPAYVVAVAPSSPGVVYVGTPMGVFTSTNRARSWHSAGLAVRSGRLALIEPRITSLAVDPRAPTTVYAARSAWTDDGRTLRQELFKSSDGGRSWHDLRLAARLVTVSSADPRTVFAIGGSVWKKNRLFRSTDGGRNWRPADRGFASTRFSALAFDPTAAATVYAATDRGVLKSTDGGTSWHEASVRRAVSAIAVDPSHPETLYAGTDGGVITSLDGAGTWRIVNTVLGGHGRDRGYGQVSSLVVDPLDSRTIYATVGCIGIFKSTDGGRRWRSANAAGDFACLDTSFALDPHAPKTAYAVYPGRGVFMSTDGAVHWHATNTGLSLTTVSSLAVDPHRPQVVYASTGPQGLFRSSDGGMHWQMVARRLRNVTAVALDPHDPPIVLAAARPGHAMERSSDGGRTWQPAGVGLGANVRTLVVSGDRAYAGTFSRGVFSSSDGGRTWHGLSGPGNDYVQALAIAPDDPTVVYAGSVGSNARGLSKSTDGGQSWRRLTDALDDTDIFAVALDPQHPAVIYIGTGGAGVFKSTDGGVNWQHASSGLPRIRMKATTATGKITSIEMTVGINAFAVDPADPTTLYTATAGRGIFRSTNAGRSWHPFNAGLTVLDVASLGMDATGRRLYAGTVNGGVVALRITGK